MRPTRRPGLDTQQRDRHCQLDTHLPAQVTQVAGQRLQSLLIVRHHRGEQGEVCQTASNCATKSGPKGR